MTHLNIPDRIRQSTLWVSNRELYLLCFATRDLLPALESLNLLGEDDPEVNIPATFL